MERTVYRGRDPRCDINDSQRSGSLSLRTSINPFPPLTFSRIPNREHISVSADLLRHRSYERFLTGRNDALVTERRKFHWKAPGGRKTLCSWKMSALLRTSGSKQQPAEAAGAANSPRRIANISRNERLGLLSQFQRLWRAYNEGEGT